MKMLVCTMLLVASGAACAQQAPALPQAPLPAVPPGVSTLRPEYAPSDALPRTAAVVEGLGAPNELRDLLRAQSEAIRMLNAKIDAIDAQLRRIESRLR